MSFQVTRVQINNQVLDRIITMGSCQRGCVMVNRWFTKTWTNLGHHSRIYYGNAKVAGNFKIKDNTAIKGRLFVGHIGHTPEP